MTQGDQDELERAFGRRHWWLLIALFVVVFPLLRPWPATAQNASPVEWTRFDVDMTVGSNGVIHVVERQEISFSGGPYRNAFAEIPLSRVNDITNVKVSEIDDQGKVIAYTRVGNPDSTEPETYSSVHDGSTLNIDFHFEPARNETRTFLLEYDLLGAIRVYRDLDPPNEQIWWTAISSDTTDAAPVLASTVTLTLPQAVPLDQVVVTTESGDIGDPANYTEDGKTFTWNATNLTSGDELNIRLQFPDIIAVDAPSWQQADDASREQAQNDADRKSLYNLIFLGIAALGLVVGSILLYGLWYTRGRDPQVGLIADFLPTPPDDLPPGAAGALIDEQAEERDIVATIVDLGRRGVFQIEDVSSASGPDMRLTMKNGDVPMSDYERALVNDLFDNSLTTGKSVMISHGVLSNPERIKEALYDEIVRRGYYDRSPRKTRESFKSAGKFMVIAGLIGAFVGPGVFGVGTSALPFIVIIILGFVLQSLSRGMPRRTEAGAEAVAKWNAFKRYLQDIQKYEQLEAATDKFETYLPFAIAFGIDRAWVEKFSRARVPAPSWFGPVIIPGGGGLGPYQTPRTRGGTFGIPRTGGTTQPGSGGGFNMPDFGGIQSWSDRTAHGLQSGSDTFVDMLNSAGRAFGGFSGGGGSSRRTGSFGSFGGGGGRGFSGGGSRGGGGGGGRRGFS